MGRTLQTSEGTVQHHGLSPVDSFYSYEYDSQIEHSFLGSYLPYLLRRTDQALSAAFYRSLSERGIQGSEWRVLAVLHEGDEMTMREVTTTALSPQPTISHAIARLVGRGLVERISSPDDGRVRLVRLTAAGRELSASLIDEAREHEQGLLSEAGIDDLGEVAAALGRLCARLETPEILSASRGPT